MALLSSDHHRPSPEFCRHPVLTLHPSNTDTSFVLLFLIPSISGNYHFIFCLWIWLLWEYHISGITQYLSVCSRLISLSLIFSRFILVVCDRIYFSKAEKDSRVRVCVCVCVCVCTDTTLSCFVHLPVDILVVSILWLLWIMFLWTLVYRYVIQVLAFNFVVYIPLSRIAGSVVILY